MYTLDKMPPDRLSRIISLPEAEATDLRLRNLGFCVGSEIKNIGKAPFGDPILVQTQGGNYALRTDTLKKITVTPSDSHNY